MGRTYTFKEFKTLVVEDQVNYINDLLAGGETLTAIGTIRHINKAYIRDTFKANNYLYSKDRNSYSRGSEPVESKCKCYKEMDLADIEDRLQFLEEQIALIRNIKKDPAANKIAINTKMFSGNIKTRSFKIYENILNDFIEYCNKNKNFRQQDLMTQALYEFISKGIDEDE